MKYFLALILVFGVLSSCGFEKESVNNDVSQQLNNIINEITQEVGDDKEEDEEVIASAEEIEGDETEQEVIKDNLEMSGTTSLSTTQKLVSELEASSYSASNYIDYNSTLIGDNENTVIFFHASWCPSCTAAEEGILSGDIPENLTILKADFDTQLELRKKYRVVAQHTFVSVDADGDLISKWVGGTTVDAIVEKL